MYYREKIFDIYNVPIVVYTRADMIRDSEWIHLANLPENFFTRKGRLGDTQQMLAFYRETRIFNLRNQLGVYVKGY